MLTYSTVFHKEWTVSSDPLRLTTSRINLPLERLARISIPFERIPEYLYHFKNLQEYLYLLEDLPEYLYLLKDLPEKGKASWNFSDRIICWKK